MKTVTKNFLCLLSGLVLAAGMLTGCSDEGNPDGGSSSGASEAIDIRMAVINGPTGVGAVNLWANQDNGTAQNRYSIEMVTTPDTAINKLAAGEVDIAAVPTNLAATLSAKTDGSVQVLAVNTLGVLYILENGETIQTIDDLKGKTIYSTGQGSNPEYVLNYVLEKNGLTPGEDVTIEFLTENQELATRLLETPGAVAMVPEPLVTTIKTQNPSIYTALSMTEEWDKVANGESSLMMGCIVANKEFVAAHPEGIRTFLWEYEASIERANAMRPETAKLCVEYGIIDNELVAENAIVGCNLVYIEGEDMKEQLFGYYQVLMDANPQSIGGEMPDDAFYYLGETA